MLTQQDLHDKLSTEIPDLYNAIVTDTSNGCGQSFDIVVISNVFQGKNKLQRCRLVNKVLKDQVAQIHAFGCKCYTVEEWGKLVT